MGFIREFRVVEHGTFLLLIRGIEHFGEQNYALFREAHDEREY